jgi:phosphorylcholine metabolism protein LicD
MSYPKFKEWNKDQKQELLDNFKLLEQEFNKLGYDLILYGGTLLGYIRNKDFIPTDNDLDFIIMHKSHDKQIVRQEIIDINTYFDKQHTLCTDMHLLGHCHYYKNTQFFDGWNGWIGEDNKLYICFDLNGELEKQDILPLKQIKFYGHIFNIPKHPKKILTLLYGSKWEIPAEYKHQKTSQQVYGFFQNKRVSLLNKQWTQKDILLDLKDLLNANKIVFWLQTGTLLGAIRDKDFIEWDKDDIDIGLEMDNYWKVKELLDKSDFKYKHQWNKEIAVYKGENTSPHIDLFFHTFDREFAYCYSYKPNRITKTWNEEWRMKIPKKIIEPLDTIDFAGSKYKIPHQPEKYLDLVYGPNWRIPDKNFRSYPVDTDYKSVTAIVTTFDRPESLNKLVKSFYELYPDISLIIGNQGHQSVDLIYPNVTVVKLPYDCGLSYARNELVKYVKTEFVLLLEDDHFVTKELDIYKMIEVFGYDKNIGLISSRISDNNKIRIYERQLFKLNDVLISIDWNKLQQKNLVSKCKINNLEFGITDLVYNFFLAKTSILRKYPWDNDNKVNSEHLDFFLNLKLNSNVKVAFIPEVFIHHDHSSETSIYSQHRNRMYYDLIYKKYGLIKGYAIGEGSAVNYKENNPNDKI